MVTVLDRSEGGDTMSDPVHRGTMRRIGLLLAVAAVAASGPPAGSAVAVSDPPPHGAPARAVLTAAEETDWRAKLDRLAGGKTIGISLREDGEFLYRRADTKRRIPASNQKLLLAMAVLDRLDPDLRLDTMAKVEQVKPGGIVPGDLWLVGRGDPNVGPGKLRTLAARIQAAGITRINGTVMGSVSYFAHDWWAPGWKPYFPAQYVALPSALTFQGNQVGGVHISDPERRAAVALTKELRAVGVKVGGPAGAGKPPSGLEDVASVSSPRLIVLLRKMLRPSSNLRAELLGKLLAVARQGAPGTVARGAAAVEAWADAAASVTVLAFDGSGLSYSNRVAPAGMVKLLGAVESLTWSLDLLDALPGPGQGTLGGRLFGVPVKAKTGSLIKISTLSGWVYLQQTGTWAEFSIMSRGMSADVAKPLEDKIVRVIAKHAS
jgi:D-alanyl-D-alanine carboxypeptidase/D-alanyl-D-alanine-endopeptidase (penicillin-binding protein 4)